MGHGITMSPSGPRMEEVTSQSPSWTCASVDLNLNLSEVCAFDPAMFAVTKKKNV